MFRRDGLAVAPAIDVAQAALGIFYIYDGRGVQRVIGQHERTSPQARRDGLFADGALTLADVDPFGGDRGVVTDQRVQGQVSGTELGIGAEGIGRVAAEVQIGEFGEGQADVAEARVADGLAFQAAVACPVGVQRVIVQETRLHEPAAADQQLQRKVHFLGVEQGSLGGGGYRAQFGEGDAGGGGYRSLPRTREEQGNLGVGDVHRQ